MPKLSSFAVLWGLLLGSGLVVSSVAAQEAPVNPRSRRDAEAQVSQWLEQHRASPPAIRAFVQRMPKGGDIHTHLSGAVYAERYLEWAAADGYCIDPQALTLIPPSACGQNSRYFPASQLPNRPDTYDALINLWSTRNLPFANRSGHDQFFQAFGGFSEISSAPSRQDDMVAEVANRAAAQHIHHLELMLTVQGRAVRQLGAAVGCNGDAERTRQRLLAAGLLDLVEQGRQQIDTLTRDTARTLGCGTPAAQPGCGVTVRFLQQSQRTRPPAEVFAQLVYAFELARASSSVVGINLVAPEDHPQALRDYTLQMRMLQTLKARSPDTRVALHAGELRLGLVPPERLRYHIRQAVELAGAERIGHGVAVMTEEEPFQLLREMARRGVLVEICLTSNDGILDVKGPDHPLQEYRKAGVPVALASDDEGISRIDLSHEFMLAVQRHGLGYRDLKQLARNSLQHSFLPGASLWSSACAREPLGAASPSAACSRVLAGSERARAQWRLEAELARFERLPDFQGADP